MNKDRTTTFIIWTLLIAVGIVFKFMPDFYFWQGRDFYKKQDFVKAHKSLQKAYSLNKYNKDIRYYYAKTLTNLTPNLTVQKAVFELATSKQQDSAQQVAENQISLWRSNVLRKIGDNYIEQVPFDKGVLRWDESRFPLKIIINNQSGQELPPYYLEEITKAFEQWQTSSGFITFATTQKTHNADIIINIEPTPSDMCSEKNCKYVVGFTTPSVKGENLKNMTITLYTKDAYNNFFSDKELYNTILHEIGHAIGLGHSHNPADIMYTPHQKGINSISQGDKLTVNWLYTLPQGADTSEVASKYGIGGSNIDEIIAKFIDRKSPTEFEKVKASVKMPQRDLLEEQETLANLRKYHMALQNVKISDDMKKFFNGQKK